MSEFERLTTALAGRYRVERVLGQGGMATVYLADDLRHGRKVAVKVLRAEIANAIGSGRFLREIRIAARLQHPHILALHDSGEADGLLFYVMPYVGGESLREVLRRLGTLSLEHALAVADEVADALSYAHREGVVHRDIKPENILFFEGHAVVADFGIARAITSAGGEGLTRIGVPLGTPGYMSPEQAVGDVELDARTDVYSLACVLYEMLVGEVPSGWIGGSTWSEGRFVKAPQEHRIRLDRLPAGTEPVLIRGLAIDPEERFGSPLDLVAAVREAPSGRQYSRTEVGEIIRQAAELQARAPSTGDGLSTGGIERIAAEVDIPAAYVEQARQGLEPAPPTPPARVLGVPSTIRVTRTVARAAPPAALDVLLGAIRQAFGQHGQLHASLGPSLSWSSDPRASSSLGRQTMVDVSVRADHTRITVQEDETQLLGVAMGVGALPLGALAMLAANLASPVWLLATGLGIVGVGVNLWRTHRRRRKEYLTRVADRLAALVSREAAALPPGSPAE